jgi:hypothetical protein
LAVRASTGTVELIAVALAIGRATNVGGAHDCTWAARAAWSAASIAWAAAWRVRKNPAEHDHGCATFVIGVQAADVAQQASVAADFVGTMFT